MPSTSFLFTTETTEVAAFSNASYVQTYAPGAIPSRPGDDTYWMFPRTAAQDQVTERGIMFCHGAGSPPNAVINGTLQGSPGGTGAHIWAELAETGFILLSTQRDMGGVITINTWGNADAITNLTNDRTFLLGARNTTAALPTGLGARTGKIALIVFSMGHVEGWNLIRSIGAANVAGIVSVEGVMDLEWFRGGDAPQNNWTLSCVSSGISTTTLTSTTNVFTSGMAGNSSVSLHNSGAGLVYPITGFTNATHVTIGSPPIPSWPNGTVFDICPNDLRGSFGGGYLAVNNAYTNDPSNPHNGTTPTDADMTTIGATHNPFRFVPADPTLQAIPELMFCNIPDNVVGYSAQAGNLHRQFAANKGNCTVLEYVGGGHTATNVEVGQITEFLNGLAW